MKIKKPKADSETTISSGFWNEYNKSFTLIKSHNRLNYVADLHSCNICQKTFENPSLARDHVRAAHSEI